MQEHPTDDPYARDEATRITAATAAARQRKNRRVLWVIGIPSAALLVVTAALSGKTAFYVLLALVYAMIHR